MSDTGTYWYVVNEVPASHLVCHRKFTQVDGYGDEVGEHRQEVTGPVSVLTEHEYVVSDDDGTLGELCGTRTRLVVRSEVDVVGNGSEYGITPSVVDDDDVYKSYVFSVRSESPSVTSTRPDESDRSAEVERTEQSQAWARVDVTPEDRLLLVRDFVAERLRVTGDEADTLPVKVAFREYRNWCYDRSLREDETLPFTGVMKALGSMGITRTERPQASPDHDEWSGFALTGVRLHD